MSMSPGSYYGRCRMHGGMSPGAPKGNTNAFKHRHYTAEAIATRREIAKLFPLRFQVGPPALSGIPRHQWGTPPSIFRTVDHPLHPLGQTAQWDGIPTRCASARVSGTIRLDFRRVQTLVGRAIRWARARGADIFTSAGAQHFQQCAEFLPLRLRSWSARRDNIARSARREGRRYRLRRRATGSALSLSPVTGRVRLCARQRVSLIPR
jgi:hypothetical protein